MNHVFYTRRQRLFCIVLAVIPFFTVTLGFKIQESLPAERIEDPKIVIREGKEELMIPWTLTESIKGNFPDLRLPGPSDLTSLWIVHKKPGSFPFVTWADFNGDGLTDVAVILFADEEWAFVIFHQKTNKSYEVEYEYRAKTCQPECPKSFFLDVVKKGNKTIKGDSFPFDAVAIGKSERGITYFWWDERKRSYELISY